MKRIPFSDLPDFGFAIVGMGRDPELKMMWPDVAVGPFRTEQEAVDYLAQLDGTGQVVPLKMATPREVLSRRRRKA